VTDRRTDGVEHFMRPHVGGRICYAVNCDFCEKGSSVGFTNYDSCSRHCQKIRRLKLDLRVTVKTC